MEMEVLFDIRIAPALQVLLLPRAEPGGAAAGIADSKLPDMQAGWEQMCSNVMAGLSGLNMVYEAAGNVPTAGDSVEVAGYQITVEEVAGLLRQSREWTGVLAAALERTGGNQSEAARRRTLILTGLFGGTIPGLVAGWLLCTPGGVA